MKPIAALHILALGWLAYAAASHAQEDLAAHCEDMLDTRNLTLYRAEWRPGIRHHGGRTARQPEQGQHADRSRARPMRRQ